MNKTKTIFNWNLTQKKFGIKWWEKILLLFKKPYYGVDYGYKDSTAIVTVKKMNKKIYIIDEKIADNLKVRLDVLEEVEKLLPYGVNFTDRFYKLKK